MIIIIGYLGPVIYR